MPSGSAAGSTPDPLGSITVAPGEPIRIASLLTDGGGPDPSVGDDAQRGVQLALDFLDGTLDGSAGQLMGHPVELDLLDERCVEGAAPQPELRRIDTLAGVIGPGCAGSVGQSPVTDLVEAGVVMISPTATDPDLIDPATRPPTLFRTAYDAKLEGLVVADFALGELEASRGALAYDESGAEAAAIFRSIFEDAGGIVIVSGFLAEGKAAEGRVVQAIALGRPEVAFLDAMRPACADAATAAGQEPNLQTSAVVVSAGCFDAQMLVDPPSSPAGFFVVGPDLTQLQRDDFYRREFLPAYLEQFGTLPTAPFHAQAYDATLILLDALDRVAVRSDDGTLTIGRTALREAVESTSGVTGLSGTITCTPTGECAPETTIAIYALPEVPLAGGTLDAEPVFSETVSLADLEP